MKQLLGPGTSRRSSSIARALSKIGGYVRVVRLPSSAVAARMGDVAAFVAGVIVLVVALSACAPVYAQSSNRQSSKGQAKKNQAVKHPAANGQRGVVDADANKPADLSTGDYYALVIGNNNYTSLPKLRTAENDAVALDQVLRTRYGFQTKLLRNATRNDILTALADYRNHLKEKSNLLISFSGHGYNDRDAGEAYWLPIDAQSDNNENWISADDITRDVRAIASLHVLIISDSCYSGDLTRAAFNISLGEHNAVVAKMIQSKSRTLLSSGGDEPVSDSGGGTGHSVFAGAILASLQQVTDPQFTASSLFENVRQQVAAKSGQTPQYDLIRNSGHEWGDFVFSQNGAMPFPKPIPTPSGATETRTTDIDGINEAVRLYQDAYNQLNASELWTIWPTASAKTKRKIEDSFASASSIQMSIQASAPEIAMDGTDARVKGSFSQTFTPKNDKPQQAHGDIVFVLKKANDKWTIVDRN